MEKTFFVSYYFSTPQGFTFGNVLMNFSNPGVFNILATQTFLVNLLKLHPQNPPIIITWKELTPEEVSLNVSTPNKRLKN